MNGSRIDKIRKGDRIIVRIGKDENKQSIVLAVLAEHAVAEGMNVAKEHVRPNLMLGITGGVVDKVTPIYTSNITLVGANGKSSRVGIKVGGGVGTCVLRATGAAVGA